jgi:hypothetical protein
MPFAAQTSMAKRRKVSNKPRRRRRTASADPPPSVRATDEPFLREGDTSPRLSGGDLDADWRRAASAGDEAVGGSAATPDQDVVDQLGDALGVPRAPDEEFRTSDEILKGRDRHRWEQEP